MNPFLDEANLKQMLNLKSIGWSMYALSLKYDCELKIVRDLCRLYKPKKVKSAGRGRKMIFPKEEIKVAPPELKRSKYDALIYENINRGKSYQEYLNDDLDRKTRQTGDK